MTTKPTTTQKTKKISAEAMASALMALGVSQVYSATSNEQRLIGTALVLAGVLLYAVREFTLKQ